MDPRSKEKFGPGNQPVSSCDSKQAVGGRGKRINGLYSSVAALLELKPVCRISVETQRDAEG